MSRGVKFVLIDGQLKVLAQLYNYCLPTIRYKIVDQQNKLIPKNKSTTMDREDNEIDSRVKEKLSRVVKNVYMQAAVMIGGFLQLIIRIFNINTTPIVEVVNSFLFSAGGNRLFLLVVLFGLYRVYRRIGLLLSEEESTRTPQIETDGGRPRDSKGRYTSPDDGNLLIPLLLGGFGGYLIGTEVAVVDPITGAIIGVIIGAVVLS